MRLEDKKKHLLIPRVSFVGVGSALVPFMGIIFVFSRTDTLTVIVRAKATRKRPVTCCRVPKKWSAAATNDFLEPAPYARKVAYSQWTRLCLAVPSLFYAPVSGMKCTKNRLKKREAKSAETKKRNVRWFSTSHIVSGHLRNQIPSIFSGVCVFLFSSSSRGGGNDF